MCMPDPPSFVASFMIGLLPFILYLPATNLKTPFLKAYRFNSWIFSNTLCGLFVLPPPKSLGTCVPRLRDITSDLGLLGLGPPCARCSVVSVVLNKASVLNSGHEDSGKDVGLLGLGPPCARCSVVSVVLNKASVLNSGHEDSGKLMSAEATTQ